MTRRTRPTCRHSPRTPPATPSSRPPAGASSASGPEDDDGRGRPRGGLLADHPLLALPQQGGPLRAPARAGRGGVHPGGVGGARDRGERRSEDPPHRGDHAAHLRAKPRHAPGAGRRRRDEPRAGRARVHARAGAAHRGPAAPGARGGRGRGIAAAGRHGAGRLPDVPSRALPGRARDGRDRRLPLRRDHGADGRRLRARDRETASATAQDERSTEGAGDGVSPLDRGARGLPRERAPLRAGGDPSLRARVAGRGLLPGRALPQGGRARPAGRSLRPEVGRQRARLLVHGDPRRGARARPRHRLRGGAPGAVRDGHGGDPRPRDRRAPKGVARAGHHRRAHRGARRVGARRRLRRGVAPDDRQGRRRRLS